jgi:membrane protein DedA with SNARE-associated domain
MIAAALASSPPPLPGFLNALSGTLQHFGLWAIGLLIMLEDFGIPVPGETILIAGAIFAGAGRINIVALGVVAFVAAVTGDNIGFAIGHFGGRALALRFGKYVFLTEERLNRAEAFFDRRGSIVITFARFVEGLRQANGIIAGITGMHWLRFVIFNAIGAALWVGTWVTIGYFAGNNITTVYHYITLYSYYVLAGLAVLIAGYIFWRRRRRRAAASGSASAPAASQTDEADEADEAAEDGSASEAAEPSPDQHGPARAVPEEQETAEIAPTEHVPGPSVPDRHAPEQPSRRQGS